MDSIWLTNRSRPASDCPCCANAATGERSNSKRAMKKTGAFFIIIFGNMEAQAGKPVLQLKFEVDIFNIIDF